MGLFQHRPEDPTEWAGLPSEPLDDESVAQGLPGSSPVDTGLAALFGEGATTSVVVPVTVTDESDEPPADHAAPPSPPPQSHA